MCHTTSDSTQPRLLPSKKEGTQRRLDYGHFLKQAVSLCEGPHAGLAVLKRHFPVMLPAALYTREGASLQARSRKPPP